MKKTLRIFWALIILFGIMITFVNIITLKLESQFGMPGAKVYFCGEFLCGDDGEDCYY